MTGWGLPEHGGSMAAGFTILLEDRSFFISTDDYDRLQRRSGSPDDRISVMAILRNGDAETYTEVRVAPSEIVHAVEHDVKLPRSNVIPLAPLRAS